MFVCVCVCGGGGDWVGGGGVGWWVGGWVQDGDSWMSLSTISLPLPWIHLNGIEFYSFYILYILSAARGIGIVTLVNAVLPYMPVVFKNQFFPPSGFT